MSYNKYLIDDGFYSHLVENAELDSVYEIPVIKRGKNIIIPKGLVPFDKRNLVSNKEQFIHFYMHDTTFKQFLNSTDKYVDSMKLFDGVITPDCSLYRDMPLNLQITNTYFNRAVGCYLQSKGIYVIPNVRWGDERSYLPLNGEVPFAFVGVPKNYIVSISTHGCIKSSENRYYFKEGLNAMMDYLKPEVVLVHGKMPDDIFGEYLDKAQFINYPSYYEMRHK